MYLLRRGSQFDPAIDKERKFISNLRWNMPVRAQTVPSVPLREQPVLAHGDIRPLTKVVEHALMMPTTNHHYFTSSHSMWSDNVSRGRQHW